MCTNTPIKFILRLGKYSFWYAGKQCLNRGLVVWTGKRHIRLVPLNRFKHWIDS